MDGNRYEYGPVMKAPSDQEAWNEWDALTTNRKSLLEEVASKHADLLAGAEKDQWEKSSARDRLNRMADPKGPFGQSPLHPRAADLSKRFTESEKRFTPTLVARELDKPHVTTRSSPASSSIGSGSVSSVKGS